MCYCMYSSRACNKVGAALDQSTALRKLTARIESVSVDSFNIIDGVVCAESQK